MRRQFSILLHLLILLALCACGMVPASFFLEDPTTYIIDVVNTYILGSVHGHPAG